MKLSKKIFLITFVLYALSFAQNNFSIKNLKSIPSYERYEFKAVGTEMKESPVVIEYTLINKGTDSASWLIKGSMPINQTMIEEEYVVRLKDLNVMSSTRRQTFQRGYATNNSTYSVSNKANTDGEFVISTIQGLMYIIRTYPLSGKQKEIIVRMAQSSNNKLGIKIKNKGKVKLNVPKFGPVKPYSVGVSLAVPFIGGILPNVTYYFLDDDVHTLAGMKGAFSMTGKKLNVLLVNYESKM